MKPCPLDTWTVQRLGLPAGPLDRAGLRRSQSAALRELVAHCSTHSAFYRRKWAGLDLEGVLSIEDLPALPCTSEAELREHGQEMLCVSQDAVARIMTLRSSGSTGPAKRLFFTEEDLERTRNFFHHGMLHLLAPGERVAVFLPGASPDSTGALLAEAISRVPAPCRVFGMVEDMAEAARQLAGWPATVLVGLPVQMLALARMMLHRGSLPASISRVLLCADYVAQSVRTALAGQCGWEVFSHYGSVESGLGAAVDCSAHNGLHLCESELFVEILDDGLQPLPAGEWGEIVLTTLSRRGMPLVRYRSGDQGRLLPGTCPCGTVLARLDQVRGRRRGQLPLAGGRRLGLADLDEALLPLPGLLDFQASLQAGPAGSAGADELHLHLNVLPGHERVMQEQALAILASMASFKGLRVQMQCSAHTAPSYGAKRQLFDYREDRRHENTC